ncbi:hypothetical protein RUMOBE_02321 [Blautia obeum ATCC 29174]|uniref:Uncharacterized protein n=1 Tax=Blautia obeum ATCC 29174 TaxID=411459 RepID=A5ZTJ2_9FIRM|nr:hypothetical protein RUMOBE_02321 [Blautia obeum ATCC 29174]
MLCKFISYKGQGKIHRKGKDTDEKLGQCSFGAGIR